MYEAMTNLDCVGSRRVACGASENINIYIYMNHSNATTVILHNYSNLRNWSLKDILKNIEIVQVFKSTAFKVVS